MTPPGMSYSLVPTPDGWYLVELDTGEIVDWFGDWDLAVQTLTEQNEGLDATPMHRIPSCA